MAGTVEAGPAAPTADRARAASPLLEAVRAVRWPPPALAYLLRVSAATLIAFWLAFFMQLPTPYSAVTTVFIVANPVRGAIVSKSAWRLGGTVVGAAAAVVQFALFAQAPILFDLFMATWVGLCCAASTLLRFFASYGTVLAGYTIVIVDVGGLSHPDGALLTALYRVSVVALGVVVTGVVFLLTQRAPTVASLSGQIGDRLVALAALIRAVLAGEPLDRVRVRRRDAGVALAALEQSIVLAGSDSLDIRRRTDALRRALTRLLGSLTSGVHAAELIAAAEGDTAREAGVLLDRALADASAVVGRGDLAAARAILDEAARTLGALADERAPLDLLAALDQARDTVHRLALVLGDLDRSHTGAPPPDGERLRAYLDWRSAVRNGLRGFLTVGIAAAFWYATEWPAGPTMLVYLVPAVALLSNLPSPSQAATKFALGTLASVAAATVLQPVLLPAVDGFPLAVGLLLLFCVPGITFQIHPRWTLVAFSYLVFLNSQVALQNPMRFDLSALLDNDEAYLLGGAALLLVFRVLIPLNTPMVVDYIAVSVADAARAVARRPERGGLGWENVQNGKLAQISDRLALAGSPRRALVVEDAAAGVMVGRLARRHARRAAAPDGTDAVRAASVRARQLVTGAARDPDEAARSLEAEAVALLEAARDAGDVAGAARDVAAMLHESARLLARHAAFFAHRPVQLI